MSRLCVYRTGGKGGRKDKREREKRTSTFSSLVRSGKGGEFREEIQGRSDTHTHTHKHTP